MLTASNLEPNPVLLRKIKRIQAALTAENNPDSDEDEESGSRRTKPSGSQRQEITSSPPGTMAARIKAERMSQARGGAESRQVSMVPGTQLSGEGEEAEEEDVEEDEEEEEAEDEEDE